MNTRLPEQGRRCTAYSWCIGHPGPRELEHRGRVHAVPGRGGRELRFALVAVGDEPPRVAVEVLLAEGGQPLELVELEPEEVLRAAATLRQLAVESQQRVNH